MIILLCGIYFKKCYSYVLWNFYNECKNIVYWSIFVWFDFVFYVLMIYECKMIFILIKNFIK